MNVLCAYFGSCSCINAYTFNGQLGHKILSVSITHVRTCMHAGRQAYITIPKTTVSYSRALETCKSVMISKSVLLTNTTVAHIKYMKRWFVSELNTQNCDVTKRFPFPDRELMRTLSLPLPITLLEHARRDGQGSVLGGDFLFQCGHVAGEGEGDPSAV
jgi:hypothetical protein